MHWLLYLKGHPGYGCMQLGCSIQHLCSLGARCILCSWCEKAVKICAYQHVNYMNLTCSFAKKYEIIDWSIMGWNTRLQNTLQVTRKLLILKQSAKFTDQSVKKIQQLGAHEASHAVCLWLSHQKLNIYKADAVLRFMKHTTGCMLDMKSITHLQFTISPGNTWPVVLFMEGLRAPQAHGIMGPALNPKP